MGLDWCLNDKINPATPRDLLGDVIAARSKDEYDRTPEEQALLKRYLISPMEYLGAKPLDLDVPETVEAFREVYESHRAAIRSGVGDHKEYVDHWSRPFEEVAKEHVGNLLLNTIPDDAMIAHNKGNPFAALSGYGSFRGKRVQYCDLLPESLKDKAFTDMEPAEMLAYADELEQYFSQEIYDQYLPKQQRLVALSKDSWINFTPKDPADAEEVAALQRELDDSPFYDHRTLFEAIHWLRFWANAGFSMWPWY